MGESSEEETVLYDASFGLEGGGELEEKVVRYEAALWALYSLLLLPAWGLGLLMLLCLPLRVHVSRIHFRSRRLSLTPDAILYQVCLLLV